MSDVPTNTVTVDIETTITTYLKRKASPFTDENWVVALGWAHGAGKPVGGYYGTDKQGADGAFATLLAGNPEYVITFNGKFDVLHLIRGQRDYEAWQEWVANGGLLWDCQLAEYLLRGQVQEAQMLSLDEVAPVYGGNVKISEVKAYWERGVNTPDIPRQLLMDYLLGRGDDHGDIGNTTKVFQGQWAKAVKRGQLQSIILNMGSLCASIEMERNGMYVNQSLGRELAEALRVRVTSLTQSLLTYLPTDLPFVFNWRSRAHLSALIFGGSVKYQARVPVFSSETGLPTYSMMDEEHFVLADGTTARVSDAPPLNVVRFAGGKQKGLPKTKKVKVPDLTRPKMRNEDFLFPLPGFTKPQRKWLGDSGYYSTSSDVIEELYNLYADKEPRGTPGVQPAAPQEESDDVPGIRAGRASVPQVRGASEPVARNDSGGGQSVPAMQPPGSGELQGGGADHNELRLSGPLPSDGTVAGCVVPLLQPGAGDAGRHAGVPEPRAKISPGRFFRVLGELGATSKDLSTYYQHDELDKEGNIKASKGMLTLVGGDNIVHHKINHTSTVTGRFSSSDPSLQNLPRGSTSDVKKMFESRFGADGSIISSDFSALEVYCQAQLTGDKQLIADLRGGLDMHCARLSTVEDKPYPEVFLLCKGDKKKGIAADPAWDLKRTLIKVFSFQR